MATSKRPASVRLVSPRKKPRSSNTTSKDHKPAKQAPVVNHGDTASEEELPDEEDQDAQPTSGPSSGSLGGNSLSIEIRSLSYSFVVC
jgi:hypothetical protein